MEKRVKIEGIDGYIKPSVARLWKRFYADYDPALFSSLVAGYLVPESVILEVGAGSGQGLQNRFPFKGEVERYVGIDVDERVKSNPNLDEGRIADAGQLPFADETFDLVFSTMVAEHLEDPAQALAEIARVLKPGGRLLFETVSKWHYAMVLARITPLWLHRYLLSRLGAGRETEDVFRTCYKLNTRKSIDRLTRQAGIVGQTRFYSMPPGYLRFSRITFVLGVAWERTLERVFEPLRPKLVFEGKKRAGRPESES